MFTRVLGSLQRHATFSTYGFGSFIISAWTLLRFFDQRMVFDLVGQQVLARQWVHGHLSGATIGPTNYILKMLFLYVPMNVLPGSPRLKLILLTLVINIATYICIGLLLQRILHLFGGKAGIYGRAALLWLAVLAGSVFWIQFSNSRNLEVVGGLLLVERSLQFLQKPSRNLGVVIAGLAAVLFFADSLQIFMAAVPAVVYAVLLASKRRKLLRPASYLAAVLLAGFIGSRLLVSAAEHIFLVHFLSGRAPASSWSVVGVWHSLYGTLAGFGHLFAGASDGGRLREAVNLLLAGLLAVSLIYAAIRRYIPKRLALFTAVFIGVDSLVYIASGQAILAGTSRYLIMTAPIAILAVSSLALAARRERWLHGVLMAAMGSTLLLNVIMLGHSLAQRWDTRFPLDAHLYSVQRFTSQRHYKVIYASMDTALPLDYLTNTASYLPLACDDSQLVNNRLFFDSSAAMKAQYHSQALVPVVLDGQQITNNPSVCSASAIINQLGTPKQTATTDDGSLVLLYSPQSFAAPKRYN